MNKDDFRKLSDSKKPRIASVVSVAKGFRKVGRIEVCSEEKLKEWKDICLSMGFKVETNREIEKESGVLLLFYSKNSDYLDRVVNLHKNFADYESVNQKLADFYGYPKCCADHFIDNIEVIIEHGDDELKFRTLENEDSGVYDVRMNNFSGGEFAAHQVCSFRCEKSFEIAKRNSEILKNIDSNFHKKVIDYHTVCIICNRENGKRTLIHNGFIYDGEVISIDVNNRSRTKTFKEVLDGKSKFSFRDEKFGVYLFK